MTIQEATDNEIFGLRLDIEIDERIVAENRETIPRLQVEMIEKERDIALAKLRILELGGKP